MADIVTRGAGVGDLRRAGVGDLRRAGVGDLRRAVKRDHTHGAAHGVVVNPLARVAQRPAPEASISADPAKGARARAKEIALGAPNRRFMRAMWRNR